MATETKEIKAFRWKGPGVLHITGRADKKLVVVPPHTPGEIEHGCIVKDPVNIAALGQERIAGLIAEGRAEEVTWTDSIKGFVRPDVPPQESITLMDAKSSEAQLQPTVELEAYVTEQLAKTGAGLSPTEKAAAEHELRKMGAAAAAPVVTRGGDAPALTPAGPDRT